MTRFLRATLLAATCGLACLSGARAADPAAPSASAFTPAQRTEIVSIVRDAMKADPSILRDAIKALQADEDARDTAEAQTAIVAHRHDLFANQGDAEAGNAHGDVTVVEFYDPRCPYCRKMLPGITAMLEKDHAVRLVYKDIPVLGPASTTESRAIVAAQNQGGYVKMQQALMSNPAQPTDDMIRDAAKSVGLDPARLAADMKSDAVAKRIDANLALAHALHVTGTPTFVVGEQIIPGMVDAGQLEQAVANARKHAEK
jgi:protein-disulfide isomerase